MSIKTRASVLEVSTDMANITARPIWLVLILCNYCTWTRSIWGFMEQSTTILNKAKKIINVIIYILIIFVSRCETYNAFLFRFSTKFVFFSSHFILSLTFRRPYIFWNVHDSSTFCQNIRPCLKSCSEMPGYGKYLL